MAATDKFSKDTSQATKVVIRRNYMTRTYSGCNLLSSDRLSKVPKEIAKSPQTLIWHSPRDLEEFPPLEPLDLPIELKLMDIILGDDPLNEGIAVEDDNKKRAELAKKNLQDALWQAGKKRVTLQERYNVILMNMRAVLKQLTITINEDLQNIINQFLEGWTELCGKIRRTRQIISGHELAELSRADYQRHKVELKQNLATMYISIANLESDLESVERKRAAQLSNELSETGNQLKRLNFQRHDAIATSLQEEATSVNLILVRNREMIYEYIQCLHAVRNELDEVSTQCFEIFDEKWFDVRSKNVIANFTSNMQECLNVDFMGYYAQYQEKFDLILASCVDQINKIVEWDPCTPIAESASKWKAKAIETANEQSKTIDSFLDNLDKMERTMDHELQKITEYWFPRMIEANPKGVDWLKADIEKTRRTQDISAGKQAALSFSSKAARNNYVKLKIMEFTICLSVNRTMFLNMNLLEAEVEVVKQIREFYVQYSRTKVALEKELSSEMSSIRVETKESLIHTKAQKAKEILQNILKSILY